MLILSFRRLVLVAMVCGPCSPAIADIKACGPKLDSAPPITADLSNYAVIRFNDLTERRAKCDEVVPLIIDRKLVQTHPDLVLRLLDNLCDHGVEARRRVVTAALAVVDDLPALAYSDVVNGGSIHRQHPRARAVRNFLIKIMDQDVMLRSDWAVILAQVPAAHVLPLVAAMTPRAKWFGSVRPITESWLAGLHLQQSERIALAGRLLAEQFPLTAVMRWTDLPSPGLLREFLDIMTPLQWLEFQLEVGPRDETVLLEIESRVPRFTNALPPRGELRGPITRLMTSPEISVNTASRVIAALNDGWTTWYGTAPMLPDLHSIPGRRRLKDRLDVFYGPPENSPKQLARASRAATRLLKAQLPIILRRNPGARQLRWSLEQYFADHAPHVDDGGRVHASILRALEHTLPKLADPNDWIHLVETKIPEGTEERHRNFVSARLYDLIRTGDARMNFLNRAVFAQPYLESLGGDDPTSVLGQLRELRDEVPMSARTEAELNRRAIERLLAPDRGVDDLLLSVGDLRAIEASRDTGTWTAAGLALRNYDIRPALIRHRRRAFVTYLLGRCAAGVTPRVNSDQLPELRRVIEDAGMMFEVVHVDSMGHAFVRITSGSL